MAKRRNTTLKHLRTIISKQNKGEVKKREDKAIYECFYLIDIIRPYFDLDMKGDEYLSQMANFSNQEELSNLVLSKATDYICQLLKIKDDKIYICKSYYEDRLSYHFTCDYKILKKNFMNYVKIIRAILRISDLIPMFRNLHRNIESFLHPILILIQKPEY